VGDFRKPVGKIMSSDTAGSTDDPGSFCCPYADGRHWLLGVESTSSPTCRNRPKTATGPREIVALKQPFAACVKLGPMFMEPSRIARSLKMPLDILVALIRLSASPVIVRFWLHNLSSTVRACQLSWMGRHINCISKA
jgi:predicted DNA-binding ribbon-helix-helix protein